MDRLAFVLSALATLCACIPSLLKGKNMKLILLLLFTNNALLATSYVLTGALNGAVSCYLGAAQTIINYFFERDNKPIPKWLIVTYALAFLIVNLFAYSRITDIVALLAVIAFVISICQKSGKQYRIWTLVNVGLWTLYDGLNLTFGPFASHGIEIAFLLAGMILHDRKKGA